MRKTTLALLTSWFFLATLTAQQQAAEPAFAVPFGVVNFSTCMMDSEPGIRGRKELDTLQQKLVQALSDIEKKLSDVNAKLSDQHYRDGLSAQADEDLRQSQNRLLQDRDAARANLYQQPPQMQMAMFQDMSDKISVASNKVAQQKGLRVVLGSESLTYYDLQFDITADIIQELNAQSASDAAATGSTAPSSPSGEDASKG